MQMKQWSIRLALGFVLCVSALGCHLTDTFLAQATITPTRTRTVKPTFTTIPSLTVTPIPPTLMPTLTSTPTRRPTPRPPTRAPTKPPAPAPPAAPQPTKPTYQYSAASWRCEHSGGSWLKGHVYADKNDPTSAVPGAKVAFGGAGGDVYATVQADDNGDYAFVLSPDGAPAKIGTYYLWITDNSGNRISDMAGPIQINGLGADAPNTCWAGWAFFVKNF